MILFVIKEDVEKFIEVDIFFLSFLRKIVLGIVVVFVLEMGVEIYEYIEDYIFFSDRVSD